MKIGFLSLPMVGHLNPMTALARKLQSRGHESLFFGIPDVSLSPRQQIYPLYPFAKRITQQAPSQTSLVRWQRSKTTMIGSET